MFEVKVGFVVPGDTVRMNFDRVVADKEDAIREGFVTHVQRRYGSDARPLITYTDSKTGKTEQCDLCFITEILDHKYYPWSHINTFKGYNAYRAPGEYFSSYVGVPEDVLLHAIGNLHMDVTRDIDAQMIEEFIKLPFVRTKSFSLEDDDFHSLYSGNVLVTSVSKKKLHRWVRQNINRYLLSAAKQHVEENKRQERWRASSLRLARL